VFRDTSLVTTMKKIYSYLCHAIRPEGLRDDCAEGLPPGSVLRDAQRRLTEAGIGDILAHSLPPAPGTDLGKIMADNCYAHAPTWHQKATEMFGCKHGADDLLANYSGDVCYDQLNKGNEQVWACDGTFEKAIEEVCESHNVVTGASTNALSMYLKALALADGTGPHSSHPAYSKIDALYPEYLPTGRSMDIWSPDIVDVLTAFNSSLFDGRRRLGGLWLTLGGPFLWGETAHTGDKSIYRVRTDSAKAALGREGDIDCDRDGDDIAPIIAKRLGRLASDLMTRLRALTQDFYFHTYMVPPESRKPAFQAAGIVGVAQELCERISDLGPDIRGHIIVSHAWDYSPQSFAHAQALQRRFPNIEFIAGVGWEKRARLGGMARLCEGYNAIEIGCEDKKQWDDLPAAVAHLKALDSLL